MKKSLFALVLLCLLAALAVSCGQPRDPDECKHRRLKETQYAPDCSLEGYILHVCLDCGHTYKSDFVEPFGHVLTSQITPQTCTKEGYTTYSCPCGYSYRTAFVIPNGHNLRFATIPPTCSADGYDLYECNLCEYAYRTNFTSMGHDLKETVIAPNCEEEGYTQYDCRNCSYSYKTDVLAPLGHDIESTTVPPTFTESGHTVYSCDCGFYYIGDYVWYSNIFSGIRGNEHRAFSYGVDLSYHNKTVDFEALADDGVDFVILRVGYLRNGKANEDDKFDEYYAAAREAGLDIGAYIYSYNTDVDELVDNTAAMLKLLAGKTFEYPIYLDVEDDSQKPLPYGTLMDMCYAYCELLVENGYYPGIYSYRNFINSYMDPEQLAARFEVWTAHYLNEDDDYYADEYNMWQYTDVGRVDGVVGDVDMNICYKDYPSIIKKYGYNGYTK